MNGLVHLEFNKTDDIKWQKWKIKNFVRRILSVCVSYFISITVIQEVAVTFPDVMTNASSFFVQLPDNFQVKHLPQKGSYSRPWDLKSNACVYKSINKMMIVIWFKSQILLLKCLLSLTCVSFICGFVCFLSPFPLSLPLWFSGVRIRPMWSLCVVPVTCYGATGQGNTCMS